MDEATDVSALISVSETERVEEWIAEAATSGARIATGNRRGDDGVLAPTVIVGAQPTMKVCAKEVFGPVVAITTYDTLDEAIALANDTEYGLQAGIFTSDITKAMKAVRALDFGGVLVNEVPTWRADQQPYGGLRDSGNTREGPAYSIKEMTEIRMVVITG
jgi:acyl-CoA reductase-like NAD-dependent aldehyde dehydrogenase